jgi:hypothetical protein
MKLNGGLSSFKPRYRCLSQTDEFAEPALGQADLLARPAHAYKFEEYALAYNK